MDQYAAMIRRLQTPQVSERIAYLYGSREGTLVSQTRRYTKVLKRHEEAFSPNGEVLLISAPGRTEIGGNHTDHNHGRVLAASVNLDCLCAVSARDDMLVHLHSEGYRPLTVDLSDLSVRPNEKGTTTALIRGVAARMKELGYAIGGFDAAATSTVSSGSGLSSSAAFEVLVSGVLDRLFNRFDMDFKTRAKISQYAENVYFGKPSGLMDQMASAAGGLVSVDFHHEDPDVRPLQYDFAAKGYALVVVATGGSHANLTADYAAIPAEMRAVAACFGEQYLRDVRPEEFFSAAATLRGRVSDRAIMRAYHYFNENERADREVAALERDDLRTFFDTIIDSGRSSFMYLQNVYARTDQQQLSVALALAESLLKDCGAWRVHGGGFAGTTLNFVPTELLPRFVDMMENAFGEHCCRVLDIRPVGAAVLNLGEE